MAKKIKFTKAHAEGLQKFICKDYKNLQIFLEDQQLTIVFTPQDYVDWDANDIGYWITYYTDGEVSGELSNVTSKFCSDSYEHVVYLTFNLK
jgi:hypothetical protein